MSATTNNTSPPKKQVSTSVPAFQFSVLTCAYGIATKIFHADGKQVPYSNIKHFHFKYCEIDSLEDFSKLALTWLATESTRFIIRGQLKPGVDPTRKQRRLLYPKDDTPATIECPPRRWVVLDCDDVTVPTGLGSGSKLAEAGYFVRDNILPSYFRGVRCVAAASPSTGRRGPTIARLRLFFILKEAADNDALYVWLSGLSQKFLFIDPSVIRAHQPIYTARPIFFGCADPVPTWGRVALLDGYEEELEFELPRGWKPKVRNGAHVSWVPEKLSFTVPDELLEVTARDAGVGVPPMPTDISNRAWLAIRDFFDACDGAPKNGVGRHETLNAGAWQLARLVAECELPETKAREAYWEAVKGINNGDGKYDAELLERHINDAFSDVCRK